MIKIFLTALICGMICITVKVVNGEFFIISVVISGIILLACSFEYFSNDLLFLQKTLETPSIPNVSLKSVFKIAGIGYVSEFTASVLSDFGLESLSKKSLFIGKVLIISSCIPIMTTLFKVVGEFCGI